MGQATGIHAVGGDDRPGASHGLGEPPTQWREAAIEPHHQDPLGIFERPFDRLQALLVDRQRLLDEDVLALFERLDHVVGVGVVASRDHYRVHPVVGDHRGGIGRGDREAPTRAAAARAEMPVALATATISAPRAKGGSRTPRAKDPAPTIATCRREPLWAQCPSPVGGGAVEPYCLWARVVETGVAQEDAQRGIAPTAEQVVSARAVCQIEGVRSQARGAQLPGGHQAQHLLEVAPLVQRT